LDELKTKRKKRGMGRVDNTQRGVGQYRQSNMVGHWMKCDAFAFVSLLSLLETQGRWALCLAVFITNGSCWGWLACRQLQAGTWSSSERTWVQFNLPRSLSFISPHLYQKL
jgi:hypothetical protein